MDSEDDDRRQSDARRSAPISRGVLEPADLDIEADDHVRKRGEHSFVVTSDDDGTNQTKTSVTDEDGPRFEVELTASVDGRVSHRRFVADDAEELLASLATWFANHDDATLPDATFRELAERTTREE
ncbi:DUF7500 family protein [Haloprofundus salinisoli]|uniref:DUF7500 family protein n=1 Tax=Haloprofundus salinisoli TaxID=2876193 RepID=UPI001CCAE978|nr:hypothetical protein [Haloprofundus salinisoli]